MDLPLPLPQSPEFARASAAMGRPLQLCRRRSGGAVRLWWQVQSRRFGLLGRVDLISRGPVARDPADLEDWPACWRRWHDGRPLLLNAEGIAPERLRQAGFWPVMTPACVAMLPLGGEDAMRRAMRQKWRNRLNRARSNGLRIEQRGLAVDDPLLRAEAAQARRKGYRGLPVAFAAAFDAANPGKALIFEARKGTQMVAAALILCHGPVCTWQIGHSTEAGRRLNAMNLVLWTAMCALAEAGHGWLDLGSLNRDDAPGLSRFKLGNGAEARQLGGTWLHCPALAPLARRLPLRLAA